MFSYGTGIGQVEKKGADSSVRRAVSASVAGNYKACRRPVYYASDNHSHSIGALVVDYNRQN